MNVYSCLETLDYYYIESGLHFRFSDLIAGDEDIIFFFCNMCQPNMRSIAQTLVEVSLRYASNTRVILIHLDALYGSRDSVSNIDILQYESDIFHTMDALFSLTLYVECFHIEHLSVLQLLRHATVDEISLEAPTHCVYRSGAVVSLLCL